VNSWGGNGGRGYVDYVSTEALQIAQIYFKTKIHFRNPFEIMELHMSIIL